MKHGLEYQETTGSPFRGRPQLPCPTDCGDDVRVNMSGKGITIAAPSRLVRYAPAGAYTTVTENAAGGRWILLVIAGAIVAYVVFK